MADHCLESKQAKQVKKHMGHHDAKINKLTVINVINTHTKLLGRSRSCNTLSGMSSPPNHWAVSWKSVRFLLPSAPDPHGKAAMPGTIKSCSLIALHGSDMTWLHHSFESQCLLTLPLSTSKEAQTLSAVVPFYYSRSYLRMLNHSLMLS